MVNKREEVITGRYFADLQAQPAALRATCNWLSQPDRWAMASQFLAAHRAKRIVLTGMGSSFHALHALNLTLIDAGMTPVMMETSELVHYGRHLLNDQTLLIAASQSGRSAETLRLLEVRGRTPLLGITNTVDGPLALAADSMLLTQAGPEATVSCKTYVTTLLVLRWLGALVTGTQEGDCLRALGEAPGLAEHYLGDWQQHSSALIERLRGMQHLFLAGRGDSLAAVGTGALILKESAHFHAEGMSSAAFRHGPMEMLQARLCTLVFSGDGRTLGLNRQLLRDLSAKGGDCEEIGADAGFRPFRLPSDAPAVRPVLEILPVQMISLALAALAGREAGDFRHASKITATE